MSLRLRAAGVLLRGPLLLPPLRWVERRTTGALDRLLEEHDRAALEKVRLDDRPLPLTVAGRRREMASRHARRVDALIADLGPDRAAEEGRRALGEAGRGMGEAARRWLRPSGDLGDLTAAATVLYRVLGIEFRVKSEKSGVFLEVSRCALAEVYSSATCRVLSAADEGVVRGLDPRVEMRFINHQVSEAPMCRASITVREEGS